MSKFLLMVSVVGSLLFVNCQKRGDQTSLQKDSLIVFFDIKHYSRGELSETIDLIDDYNPRVIGLGFLLKSLKDPTEDSLLAASFRKSGKVVLGAWLRNDVAALSRSQERFREAAWNEGVLSYLKTGPGDVFDAYAPLYEDQNQQMASFPNVIVYKAFPKELENFTKLKINTPSKIHYYKQLSDFIILDRDHLNAEQIRDKIVLFGYLGDEDEDRYDILWRGKVVKSNSCVVTANVILNILSKSE